MLLKQIRGLMVLIPFSVFCASVSAASLRDPTLPGAGSVAVNADPTTLAVNKTLVLNSILSRPNGSFAVINNEIFKQGQRVQGVKILHIGKDTVSLADGRKLTMFKAIIEIKG